VRRELAEEEAPVEPAAPLGNALAGLADPPAERPTAVVEAAEAAAEDHPASLWNLVLAGGAVSAVYLHRRFRRRESSRPAWQRGRGADESA
jgi:hypothetical protein